MPDTTTPFPGPVQPFADGTASAGVEDPARLSLPPQPARIDEAAAQPLSGPPVDDGVSASATPAAAARPEVTAPSPAPREAPPPAPSEAKDSQNAVPAPPSPVKEYIGHEDAEAAVELYPFLDAEGQAKALGHLRRYQDQQTALRQPLFPDEERDTTRQRQALYSLFNEGLDGARRVLPDRRALGGPPSDEAIARSAATAYLARRFRLPERTIGKAFEFYRDFYAREVFKTPAGVDNRTFYDLARKDVGLESQRDELIHQAADSAFQAAVLSRNAGMGEYVNWDSQARTKPGYLPGMKDVWRANYDAYRAALLPRLPMLESFTMAIQRHMDSKPMPGDSKIIADSTRALQDMPDGDRQVTLQALLLMGRRAGDEQPAKGTDLGIPGSKAVTGFAQQTGEAFSRTLLEMFDISKLAEESRLKTLGQSLDIPHTTEVGTIASPADAQRFVREQMLKISTHQAIGSPGIASSFMDGQTAAGAIGVFMLLNDKGKNRTLSDTEKALVRDQLGRDQKAIHLARQIERAATATDPVKNIAAQATGSLAAFLAVDLLPGGLGANAFGMANAAYNGILTDHSEIDKDQALAIAVTSGALQAAIFRIPVGKLVGMPSLSRHLTEGITTDLIRRSAVSALKLGPAQFGQMEVAGLTTPFLQQVGHALDADIPDPRLKDIVMSRWQEVSTQPAHVALSMLPLILLGTGAHAIRERTTVREVLSQRDHMEALGIRTDDAHRIASLLADGKVEDAQGAYQTAFSRKGPADAAKMQALAIKATARQVDDYHAYSEAVRLNLMPDYKASSDGGVTVLLPDGKGAKTPVQTTGWKEAWAVSRQYFRAEEQRRIQAVGQMAGILLNQPHSPGFTETSTYTPGKDLPFDRTTEEGRRAIAIAGHLLGMTPEAAASAHWAALGSNTLEQLQGMRSLIINSRSQAARNASVLTPVEEHIEGRVKAALRTGRHSLEQTLAWVRMAEQATGKTFLPASNEAILSAARAGQGEPRELLEAISHIVVADVMGRRKDGAAFAPGLITEGLDAHVREGMQAWHRTYTARAQDGSLATLDAGNQARTFKHFLASWREFFGQTFHTALALQKARQQGTLTQDWQRHLDDLLGLKGETAPEENSGLASTRKTNEPGTEDHGAAFESIGHEADLRDGATYSISSQAVGNWIKRQHAIDPPKGAPNFGGDAAKRHEAARIWKSLPDTVEALDGRTVRLKHNAQGTENTLLEHLITSHRGDDSYVDTWRVFSLARVPATIQNARPRFVGFNGNHIYIQRYSDGRNHYVIVSPKGVLLDHGTQDGLTSQWIRHSKDDPYMEVDSMEFRSPSSAQSEQGGTKGVAPTSPSQSDATPGALGETKPVGISSSLDFKSQASPLSSDPSTFSKKTGTGPSQIETSFSLAPSASGETEHPLANNPPNDKLSHDQTRRNSNDPPGGPGITPGIIARDVLRRDRSTVSAEPPGEALRGNTTSRRAEFDRLLESDQTRNLSFDSRRLGKQLDSAGEHMVYKAARPEDEGRVFKVTHPDRAGITGRALRLRDGSLKVMPDDALPSEYLDRWDLHNKLLDDDARFEGFIQGPHGTSLVVSHPLVKGQHPKSEELSKALFARGWRPTGDGHWQIEYHGQTIGLTDTKPANFIRTSDGAIHSIDSVPFIATQAMIDHWAKLAPK